MLSKKNEVNLKTIIELTLIKCNIHRDDIKIVINDIVKAVDEFYEKNQPYSLTDYQVRLTNVIDWPGNLLVEIGIHYLSNDDLPELEKNLMYVMTNFLNDKEHDTVLKYYRDHMTQKAIAEEYGLTTERIRQILEKALRKLSAPYRLNIIALGQEALDKYKAELFAKKQEYIDAIGEYSDKIKDIKADTAKLNDEDEQLVALKQMRENMSEGIETLNFSVRSFNALYRAGYHYVPDLYNLTLSKLWRIRNLGEKSIKEVLRVCSSNGIFIKNDLME